MNIRPATIRMALVSSASALALFLSGCDRTKNTAPTPAADATATQSTAAASPAGTKDCNAPDVSCTPGERGRGNGEGMMEGAGPAQGMANGRQAHDDGARMGGPPARR
jgi:hypothetical protein